MDRLSQLRDKAGGSRDLTDSTLDTTSSPSEAYLTANSSKYYSLSEVDSTFDLTLKNDILPIKDVSLASTTTESQGTIANADELISNLSPIGKKSDNLDNFKINTQIEAANILSGGVSIFDDNSYDGDELVIDDNVEVSEKTELKQPECLQFKADPSIESNVVNEAMDIESKDTEVVLQIDGNNVDAIDIGNGLYLYRKAGQEDLAAVQIIDDDQQPSFKFLKVRENAEGNLEVYEEIEVEVPKEVPIKDGKMADKNISSHVPIKDINKVISESSCTRVADRKIKSPQKEISTKTEMETENKETLPDNKSEVNLNGKMVKFSESRKMTYHSTPNKEGIPLTKTMVDQHLPTHRHLDMSNVKKTIEVHTDNSKLKSNDTNKGKDTDDNRANDLNNLEKEFVAIEPLNKDLLYKKYHMEDTNTKSNNPIEIDKNLTLKETEENKNISEQPNNLIDTTTKNITKETTDVVFQLDNLNKFPKDLNMDKEVQIKEKLPIISDKKNKNEKVRSVKNEDEKKEEIVNIEERIDAQVGHVENANVIKNKNVVPIENIGEYVVTQIENNENIKDCKSEHLEKVNISNNEQLETTGNIKDNTTDKPEIAKKSLENDESNDCIEIVEDECKVVPMDIDKGIESSILSSVSPDVKSNPTVEVNIQTNNKEIKDVGTVEKENLNEPIIIDDDDVSIVEVIVDSKNKETSEQDTLIIRTKLGCNKEGTSYKSKLEKIENVESSMDIEKTVTENKDLKISESPREALIIHNVVNQSELKKDVILTPYYLTFTEQDIRKGNTFPSVKEKECKIENNSKDMSKQNETSQKTSVIPMESGNNTSATVLQQDINLKSYSNVSKVGHLLKLSDTKHSKKTMESIQIKDTIFKEEITKHHIPINKALFQKPNIPEINEKNIPSTQHILNKRELQKYDNALQVSPRKDPMHTLQVTATLSKPIEIYKSSQISIAPVAKDEPRSEISAVKEKSLPVTNISLNKSQPFDLKPTSSYQRGDKKDLKIPSKSMTNERGRGVMNIEICKVPKIPIAKPNVPVKQDIGSSSKIASQSVKNIIEIKEKKDVSKVVDSKPVNNNNSGVPFGKWTEANRQEFLNKFKTKTSVASSNSNQLKNSNDLNRRDVLKKIDKQRQSSNVLSKPSDAARLTSRAEMPAFSNKSNIIAKEILTESEIPQTHETLDSKAVTQKNKPKIDAVLKPHSEPSHVVNLASAGTRNATCQRTGFVQNLIDKTIEGMIHRSAPAPKLVDETKQGTTKASSTSLPLKSQKPYKPIEQATLDEIEMKMNELHGIPFIERPPHELPQVVNTYPDLDEGNSQSTVEKQKTTTTNKTKIPNLLPFLNKNQLRDDLKGVIEVDSEDEIIEHEPITGDIDMNKNSQEKTPQVNEMLLTVIKPQVQQDNLTTDSTTKETIITEKDFDKFVRRNSITYENKNTVNFDSKEPHNVSQTVVGKESVPKNYSKKDHGRSEPKTNHHKHQNFHTNTQINKKQSLNKLIPAQDDASNRNQSKLQKAYHSVMTAKRQMAAESPITIIEDKPVKVVFMDNVDYFSNQLNVEGQDLSPAKKVVPDTDITVTTCESLDFDILDSIDDAKLQDDIKSKTKHQRKQVLTPVDEPELELIKPSDLDFAVSPKKKRRTDEDNRDKSLKYPMRKKLYLLGSTTSEEKVTDPVETIKNPTKETVNMDENTHKNSVSALDSLVKAAELIETQTDINKDIIAKSDSPSSTPVKRGRGRPRKYPLTPDGVPDKSKITPVASPEKKPRLIDAKVPKHYISTDDSDSEGEIIKENWTMGKINENIVCPICNKLFRTENVVFKHVKHCTGPSPSRSDSDKRSLRKMRLSQDFDAKSLDSRSDDMDIDIDDDKPLIVTKEILKKHASKLSSKADDKEDNIVITDTVTKEKTHKVETRKHRESSKSKIPQKNMGLVCEFCGCKFRQLSYLAKHIMLQHKNVDRTGTKIVEKDILVSTNPVYCCEVCKKEFRKLHHLVQHRIIHNPNSVPAKSLRKTSSEQSENKIDKDLSSPKHGEDQSAGFRCEPCDKSFRKLHHLVEHRETHDGINRQKTSSLPASKEDKPVEKSVTVHQCDVCKKTFKKLQHLIEHKEQHLETSSEKSDDKSVKSSLSTRDIIHECSLCYMVFPNEHSLNKHTIICQRKKRQSKLKKPTEETEGGDDVAESPLPEKEIENIGSPIDLIEEVESDEKQITVHEEESCKTTPIVEELEISERKFEETIKNKENVKIENVEDKVPEQLVAAAKRDYIKTGSHRTEVPEKIKKVEEKEAVKIIEMPKKKTPIKDKIASANKRLKITNTSSQGTQDKVSVESSDDDDVRYMLNPNFIAEDITEEKIFMNVRATKRNSLQIDRPNSKELMKRRTSLQHPPKIPRLKSKVTESSTTNKKETQPKLEPVPSTDSDDSETTKYSFPVTIPQKCTKPVQSRNSKDSERKAPKRSLGDKRKSLTGIAKRKSIGNSVTTKHKVAPLQQVKKRTLDVEHRCDCGQLFSSAALLSRHTTLAHTPPRIRRRRSPPPDEPITKLEPRKSVTAVKPKPTAAPRKPSAASSTTNNPKPIKTETKSNKKTIDKNAKSPNIAKKLKTNKSDASSSIQPRRTVPSRAVSITGKIRKSRGEK